MRFAVIGASELGVATARLLIEQGHDVVMVEADQQRIDEVAEDLDCGFIHGDGSRPHILREVGPDDTAALLCLTDEDQDNIISSLVGRSLGFKKALTKISDPDFEHICAELSLDHTINPDQTTARDLLDTLEGRNAVELSSILRGDVRFFLFTAREEDEGPIGDLSLPEDTKPLYAYRDGELYVSLEDFTLKQGDDVILLTRAEHHDELHERWDPEKKAE